MTTLTPVSITVHPHGCGEHTALISLLASSVGSSPRMWGTPREHHYQIPDARFIPTDVGNTESLLIIVKMTAVHPHGCGEHEIRNNQTHYTIGSSPRMWGTL